MNHEAAIANLLYRYAELIDDGDLRGAAGHFQHARAKVMGFDSEISEVGEQELYERWRQLMKLYPPLGRPLTKHVISNAIIEVNEDQTRAASRSYFTVWQQTTDFPLQMISAGRYLDKFERVDGVWRFSYRDYTQVEMRGDLSAHVDTTKYRGVGD